MELDLNSDDLTLPRLDRQTERRIKRMWHDGESISDIAQRNGLTVAQLRRLFASWNKTLGDKQVGDKRLAS